MFGRKKETKPPSRRAGQSLAQYGLFDVPDNLDDMGGSEDGDSDLEAELAAIAGGGKAKSRPKPKAKVIPQVDLDSLVADSLRDIPTDEEMSDGEDDPDLLNELSELADDEPVLEAPSPPPRAGRPAPPPPGAADLVTLLKERMEMYSLAEQNAKSNGESSRARRLNRGQKTLKDQLKQAMAGKPVNEEEIPPVVSTAKHSTPAPAPPSADQLSPPTEDDQGLPEPLQPTPVTPEMPEPPPVEEPSADIKLSDEAKATLNLLNERKTQYKVAALTAKKNGDSGTALACIKILKQFDRVIEAIKSGQTVDLSNMPGPPGEESVASSPPPLPPRQEEHVQTSTEDPPAVSEDGVTSSDTLITAGSVEEALQQRLDLYKQQESAAKEAGNSSKARRMGRIVKQFEQAIKQHKAGRAIPYDELPTPPGYAPIPGAPPPPKEEPEDAPPQPDASQVPGDNAGEGPPHPGASKPTLATTGRANSVRKMGNQLGTGLAGQQLATLLQRQREFKEAALDSKKKGELSEAKEYLRCAKGFDPLIEAARGGLPVDLASVPIPPQAKQQLEDSYDIVNSEDCNMEEDGVLSRLEQQLTEQLKMCLDTGEHHKAMGDVSGANRFQHLALAVKQDLDVVKMAKRLGSKSVKFHYENKQFSIVQCCTDLGDNDLELTIVRGISYTVPNPKEIDTYVKFEFPYPQEEPVSDKTVLVKDTNSPEYNAVFTIPINRSARPCLRIFKRQAIKLEVFSRGGFFSRDALLGTISVKLQQLETQTELHDSFDLMNGRKAVGGKLEVKIRVRNPMLTKQIEQTTKKWVVIDN